MILEMAADDKWMEFQASQSPETVFNLPIYGPSLLGNILQPIFFSSRFCFAFDEAKMKMFWCLQSQHSRLRRKTKSFQLEMKFSILSIPTKSDEIFSLYLISN